MAFNLQHFSTLSYSTNDDAIQMFSYYADATDSLINIVNNDAYFGQIADNFDVDDLIYISDATGLASGKGFFYVASTDIKNKKVHLVSLLAQAGGISGWQDVNTSITLQPNKGYRINNNVGTTITLTLPAPSAIGQQDSIMFINTVGGTARIAQAAGQTIIVGNGTTTTGTAGYLLTNTISQSFTLSCIASSATSSTFDLSNVKGLIQYF
jgi:hypothetical protein